jgi:hypothetical protein
VLQAIYARIISDDMSSHQADRAMTIASQYVSNKYEALRTNIPAIIDEAIKAAATGVAFATTPEETKDIDLLLTNMQQTSNVLSMAKNIEFLMRTVRFAVIYRECDDF